MNTQLMHGTDWARHDVAGWWVSEKLDGWRAHWTGSEFITRQGKRLNAPDWFTDGMPSQPLDGEIWAGDRTTHNDVNASILSGDWDGLSFRPFDIPAPGLTIETAIATLKILVMPLYCYRVQYRKVNSTKDAINRMQSMVSVGGEGLMLRKPGSKYRAGRTENLLKLKPEFCYELAFSGAQWEDER